MGGLRNSMSTQTNDCTEVDTECARGSCGVYDPAYDPERARDNVPRAKVPRASTHVPHMLQDQQQPIPMASGAGSRRRRGARGCREEDLVQEWSQEWRGGEGVQRWSVSTWVCITLCLPPNVLIGCHRGEGGPCWDVEGHA
eukprot:1161859-Pelagomonas_calceolata.AAC.26